MKFQAFFANFSTLLGGLDIRLIGFFMRLFVKHSFMLTKSFFLVCLPRDGEILFLFLGVIVVTFFVCLCKWLDSFFGGIFFLQIWKLFFISSCYSFSVISMFSFFFSWNPFDLFTNLVNLFMFRCTMASLDLSEAWTWTLASFSW